MKDRDLEQLFNDLNKIPSSAEAKLRARNAALAAFDETHSEKKNSADRQGLTQQPRLTSKSADTERTKTMFATPSNPISRWAISSMASAALIVVAFTMAVGFYPDWGFNEPESLPDKSNAQIVSADSDGKNQSLINIDTVMPPQPAIEASSTNPSAEVDEIVVTQAQPSAPMPDMAISDRARTATKMSQAPSIAMERNTKQTGRMMDITSGNHFQQTGHDRFETTESNSIKVVSEQPVSTFSVDVDTASYAFVRRQLNAGRLPQKNAVRLEEMINYFDYDYALPSSQQQPFNSNIAVFDSPWKAGNQIVHIGIKGYELAAGAKPKSNLVFLLDVSGSMNSPDKLPLVKQSMNLLLNQLNPDDTVGIVVYAGAAGTVLTPTQVKDKQKIIEALQRLQAGGSTAGAKGIQLAYQLAQAHFVENGINRIILATDGDFNLGISNREELKAFVERKRAANIFLSVLGFGQGNYHDHMMQTLAQHGNGVAAYIDALGEAQKVLVNEATSSLFTIAKDVKIQVEFNPAQVQEYRLLGYETRLLKRQDFNNDNVDAGDMGAGHTVTALYEITPANGRDSSDPLRYQATPNADKVTIQLSQSNELGFVKIRYKLAEQKQSHLISQPIAAPQANNPTAPMLKQESQFATAVAGFAQLLRGGQYTGDWDFDDAINLAKANKGKDDYGYRSEFIQLIRKAKIAQAM